MVYQQQKFELPKSPIFLIVIVAIIVVLYVVFSSTYTVEQGDRAVVLRFGELTKISSPGLHFKLPLIDEVRTISVRTQKYVGVQDVYSKDIQGASISVSINYSLNPADVAKIYSQYSADYEARIIIPQILAKVKDAFGQYNAVEIVQNRQVVTRRILLEMQDSFAPLGILVESAQIENIDFSSEYERSVEERMKAEVEVAKVRQNLEREKINAEMARTKAQGEADAILARATAEARAKVLLGEAEGKAIQARAEALAQNSLLIWLTQAERWDGKLPTTMPPLSSVPILNLDAKIPSAGDRK